MGLAMQPAAMAASAIQPIVVNLVPAGNGWLQYTQVIGTLIIALIAAGIAGTIQWRQMQIAKGALKTAANKLTLDLFDRRLSIFDAAEALIRDDYDNANDITIDDTDDETHDSVDIARQKLGQIQATQQLRNRMQGARWLLNEEAAIYLDCVWKDSSKRIHASVDTTGMTRGERLAIYLQVVEEDRERVSVEMAKLRSLFDQFLSIRH
jgi:hypothetical protein